MKTLIIIVTLFLFGLALMYAVLNSKNVKEAEYHHCMVTSTTKTECAEIIK